MSRVLTIAKREVTSIFFSPIAYVVLFLFLLFMGVFFAFWIFIPGEATELRRLIDLSRFSLFFIVPMMTMSVFSDEYKSGRIEMLRTSPISEVDLVLGKFLGALCFYLILVASTLIYLGLLLIYGRPDYLAVLSGYVGMILMGCMFVSIGIFCSAWTQNQIVAALSSMLILGTLTIISIPLLIEQIPASFKFFGTDILLRRPINFIAVGPHIDDFAKGAIETSNIVYFGGFTALFLFLTYLLLESRKWR